MMSEHGCKDRSGPGYASPLVRECLDWLHVLIPDLQNVALPTRLKFTYPHAAARNERSPRDLGVSACHSARSVSTRLSGDCRRGSLKRHIQPGESVIEVATPVSVHMQLDHSARTKSLLQVIHRLPMLQNGDELHHSGECMPPTPFHKAPQQRPSVNKGFAHCRLECVQQLSWQSHKVPKHADSPRSTVSPCVWWVLAAAHLRPLLQAMLLSVHLCCCD